MTLVLYNSLTRRKEPFVPLEPGRIGMYVCGITVYDYCHIGHFRMLVAFDVIVQHLRELGHDVCYVRNITDIDDKIIKRAAENGEPVDALTSRFIAAMYEDCAALGVKPPDVEPRATESIDAMIELIAALEKNGLAYLGDNGDVYYSVSGFDEYGKLSGKRIEDLRAGARIAVDEAKRDALDFVLWKASKPGEPSWDSPWGPGRPGWHIECSAMSINELGETFDIHGGGMDLKFPHHENEIAQSCGATGNEFARYWLHNGFVQVDNEKMSKSLGNFFTIRDILKEFRPEEIRLFLLSAHYRKPLNYSDQEIGQARANLARLYTALRGLDTAADESSVEDPYTERFVAAMNDDFNTPGALAVLFDLAHAVNRARDNDPDEAKKLATILRRLANRLGLLRDDADAYLKSRVGADGLSDEEIARLIHERDAARAARDWQRADALRDQLENDGVILEDGPAGTTWRRE